MRTFGILLIATVGLAAPAAATTMIQLDIGQLASHSSAVVVGTVTDVEILSSQPGVPLTRVTVNVTESLKGVLNGTIIVNSAGFPGAPLFFQNEELVLFIHSVEGTHVLTGLQQGRFGIVEEDGQKVLDRAIPGLDASRAADLRSLDALRDAVQASR